MWGQENNRDSVLRVAAHLETYADSCMNAGNASSAMEAFSKSAEIRKEALGIYNVEYAYTLLKASQCLVTMKNYDDAVKLGTEATVIYKHLFGPNDPAYAGSLLFVVGLNYLLGNYIEAIKMGTDAIVPLKLELGTESPRYAQFLILLSGCYDKNSNISEAIKLGTEAAGIQKKALGPEHPDYARTLSLLAGYYSNLNNYNEAIKLGTEAAEIQKKVLGPEHPDYASSLSLLAGYYSNLNNYNEAIKLMTEAADIQKKVLGPEHPDYASSLSQLASYHSNLNNYNEAIQMITEAMRIKSKVLGSGYFGYDTDLNDLAGFKSELGYYEEGITLLTEAIEIQKKNIEVDNSKFNNSLYARSLTNLATIYYNLGNYNEAIKLGTEATEINKKIHGDSHPDIASSLNILAICESARGNYVEAIKIAKEIVEIYKIVYGSEHLSYAGALTNLANDYYRLGNYAEAVRLGTESMEIQKRVLGVENTEYANSLSNLAVYNNSLGNNAEAVRLETESMKIEERVLGLKHPSYAMSLNNLGNYYYHLGNYPEAVRIGTMAVETLKEILGANHPSYAYSLYNLALCYYKLGNNAEAVLLGTEATQIREKLLGNEHPDYEASLYNLSLYNFSLCNYTEAKKAFVASLNIKANNVIRYFSGLSSLRRNNYWEQEKGYFLRELPVRAFKMQDPDFISLLYDKTALLAKGILLNTEIEMKKLIEESHNPELVEDYQKILTNQDIFNKQSSLPIAKRYLNTDSLRLVLQKQEDDLISKSKAYGDYMRNLRLSWKDVQQSLGEKDLAVEFLDFPININEGNVIYVALTLKKGYDNPRMIPLFELGQLKGIPKNTFYKSPTLAKLVWGPLEEELDGMKNVFFSPSGELHRIGIEYLPLNEEEYIFDKYKMYRISSTRQIVLNKKEYTPKQAVLYGGIDYDVEIASSDESTSIKKQQPVLEKMQVDSLSVRGSREYLKGTKIEADNIAANLKERSWDYRYYSGAKGTEESFKMMSGKSPSLLHIATHGFYMSEEDVKKEQEIAMLESQSFMDGHHLIREDKPMTRSGLLMSGCNHTLNHEDISENGEDGILTAQEIASLDLRGLDLAVLSACETGLGDVASGEGVFGLQRGFKKAGAKTIMMSLWKVSDKATEILMTTFYRHYLNGMSKYDAFTIARDKLRAKYPSRKNKPDWAAFIMLDGVN